MTLLLAAFVVAAAILWVSVFGYLLALGVVVLTRRKSVPCGSVYPAIAIVIPTLNEERFIASKLRDLRRTDYPRDRMTVVVIDGGSTDRTTTLVEQEMQQDNAVRLICMEGAPGKSEQINQVLGCLENDIVVVTDADAELEPSCIRELVSVLLSDADTALVGAAIRPASTLLEERIHWWFLNYLWWLEGEALSAAVVSGVCYAARRQALLMAWKTPADDVHLALTTGARGARVRLCRTAVAIEVRVPQTAEEFLSFRRRRGVGYVTELRRVHPADAPAGWRLARWMRLWHFAVAPKIAVGLVAGACLLLGTPHWHWPLMTLLAFAGPTLIALYVSTTLAAGCRPRWRLGLAAGHLLGLTWWSLMAVDRRVAAMKTGDPA